MKNKTLTIFEGKKIRRRWIEKDEKWYFLVVDVIEALTDSQNPRDYWYKMKIRVKNESNTQLSTNCRQLKFEAADGKKYLTDAADTETTFRIIQSIPSSKAEPFKLWLARVGYERVEEDDDPEKAIQRAMATYEWNERGVRTGDEFAILTDDITSAWAGMRTHEYKKYKNLKKENLRVNMTNLELVLNMLAEASTTEISKKDQPETFPQNRIVARKGGHVAGVARKQLEKQIGQPIISQHRRIK